ncbi:hypothetical protein V6N11_081502 [Hibiscus sabdariffa]|uniref:Uncharacterized protein n=1 Tax=Hibiscus sabdariffa TaxID=183260 RepID=A0ABR1ZNX7_9ROSI
MTGEWMKTTQSGFAIGTDPNEESKANGRGKDKIIIEVGGSWGMDVLFTRDEVQAKRWAHPFTFEKDQPNPMPILLVGQGSRRATHHFVLLNVSFPLPNVCIMIMLLE